MGSVPLTWADLDAWRRLSGHQVQPWELRALRTASIEYVSQHARSKDAGCPPPWSREVTEDNRELVSRNLHAMLSGE